MLTARQQSILQTIVAEYVRAPLPVSSETVAQKIPETVSPATIRNEMAELEEEGYISRPHASAGGVPVDKGYRAYVESLAYVPQPSPRVQALIRRRFKQTNMDVEEWSRIAAQLLASLVRTMAVATLPRAVESRWKHLDLVQIQEFLALVIMVLQGSRLNQQLLPLKEPLTQDELTRISNKLNTCFSGLSRHEIQARKVELTPFEEQLTGISLKLLKKDQEEGIPLYHIDGLRHMFDYPELAAGSRAREVAEVLEDRQMLWSILDQISDTDVASVTIGKENKADLLRPFSIVFAQYGVPSEAAGVVAIMGPTRMEYATAISNVAYLSSVMSEMVEAVQGKASVRNQDKLQSGQPQIS